MMGEVVDDVNAARVTDFLLSSCYATEACDRYAQRVEWRAEPFGTGSERAEGIALIVFASKLSDEPPGEDAPSEEIERTALTLRASWCAEPVHGNIVVRIVRQRIEAHARFGVCPNHLDYDRIARVRHDQAVFRDLANELLERTSVGVEGRIDVDVIL